MTTSFEPGAPAPEDFVPLCVPRIQGNEWKYIKECLDSNFVSSVGPFVDRFERDVADYLRAKHAIATVSGTAALHIALLLAGVKPGDEVLISTLTFIAPVNAIRYVGAWPVFMDAEPDFWQMDPAKVEKFLLQECLWDGSELRNKATGRRIKAILPVHILGHPADMDPILEIAHRFNLRVVDDAAEAMGAEYKGRKAGHLGDISCLSFNGNKVITTGGGGMIVTDDDALAKRAKYLTTQAKDDPVEYIHKEIGYNYRLTNIQAAMGCAQLEVLDDYVSAKRKIAKSYRNGLEAVNGITLMSEADWAFSSYWLSTILVDESKCRLDSRALRKQLNQKRIQSRPLWQPNHLSPAHLGAQSYEIDVAERLYSRAVSLPSSVSLTENEQDFVVKAIRSASLD